MERREFLIAGAVSAVAAAGTHSKIAKAQSPPAAGQPLAPTDLQTTVARMRMQFLREFDAAYVDNVIVPWFLVSTYMGERPALPMIDPILTKENALPRDLWGLLSESWKIDPRDGVTVFLQALEKRGPDNERVDDLHSGKTPSPEKTFVYWWIKNAGNGQNFSQKDIVFECFHNFVAFS